MVIEEILKVWNLLTLDRVSRFVKPTVTILLIIIFYFIITKIIRNKLLKHSTSKVTIHNIKVYFNIFNYIFIVTLIIFAVFYTTGNILAFGITAGLLTAALGWALQRPITGIAAWLMVVVKKPFIIGDRILINNMKGDVTDITLTHIYLKEIGGTIDSEETSGRTVMIPNAVMFERNIINYTAQDEFILDDVGIIVTYESNLDQAIRICEAAGRKILKDHLDKMPKKPYVRVQFQGSGIDIKTRYYVKANDRIIVSSEITKEIHREFKKHKDVNVAYPHTEIVLKKIPKF